MIGDLHTVALVGAEGTIDWYCPGRIDAPSVFGALLDARRGGHWSLCPAGGHWRSRQLYLPDTSVLVTRFMSEEGELEVEDFMPVGAPGHARPAGGRRARRAASRHGGRAALRLRAAPAPRAPPRRRRAVRERRPDARAPRAAAAARARARVFRRSSAVAPGELLTLSLSPGELPPLAAGAFEDTVAFWRGWLAGSRYEGRWRETVHRSALVLKLLTHAPTGALAAAATTSLPERLDGSGRRDERHPRAEDTARAAELLRRLGLGDDSRASRAWLPARADTELSGFEGWRGCGPVRIGPPMEPASAPRGSPTPRSARPRSWRERGASTRRGCHSRRRSPTRTRSGSLSEAVGPGGEQLGNFPHAASHLALISRRSRLTGCWASKRHPVRLESVTTATVALEESRRQRRGQIYVALAAIAWSSAGVLQRQLTLDTPTQVMGRAAFAGAALLVYVAVVERGRIVHAFRLGRPRRHRRRAVRGVRLGRLHRRAQPHERGTRPVHPGRGSGARRPARPRHARRADHAAHRPGDGAGAGGGRGHARLAGRGRPRRATRSRS